MSKPNAVPLLDLCRLTPDLKRDLESAFSRVLQSGVFIMGPEVERLEKALAEQISIKHAFGVSSGTDALVLALMALGIGAGDEVICPSYTFFATAGSIWRVGAKPVFIDCDPETYNTTHENIAKAITSNTKAIIVVHLFGQCAEMDPILSLCNERKIPLIEDAAQAIGAEYKGRPAGTMGAFGCFSFFPSKNLGALGDGGFISCQADDLAERAKILRVHGSKPKYYHKFVGGNFRLDALQAAFLNAKLPHLTRWSETRRQHAKLYRELFGQIGIAEKGILLPKAVESCTHIYNQFNLRVQGPGRRDALKKHLADRSVGCEIYYPVPMHMQECFASIRGNVKLPHSELAASETLAIPIFPELTRAEIETVVSAIGEFVA